MCVSYIIERPIAKTSETFGMFRKVSETIILRENDQYVLTTILQTKYYASHTLVHTSSSGIKCSTIYEMPY